jgi:hypothetical protein
MFVLYNKYFISIWSSQAWYICCFILYVMNVLLESNPCIVDFSFNISLSNSICFDSTVNHLSKANTSSGSHRKNQTRGDKKQNKKQKTHTHTHTHQYEQSASLTPVQGPSTVVCMIVIRYKLSIFLEWQVLFSK